MDKKQSKNRSERLNITIDKELNDVVAGYAKAIGKSKSTAVYLLLQDIKPVLEGLTQEIENFQEMVEQGADPNTQLEVLEQRSLVTGIKQVARKLREL